MSANVRMECLQDVGRRRFDVGVICMDCGRTVVFDVQTLARFMIGRCANLRLGEIARNMRCRCLSANVRLTPVSPMHRPQPLPPAERPMPLYVMPHGPKRRELDAARAEMRAALADDLPGPVRGARQHDARRRLTLAERAWRHVLRSGLDA